MTDGSQGIYTLRWPSLGTECRLAPRVPKKPQALGSPQWYLHYRHILYWLPFFSFPFSFAHSPTGVSWDHLPNIYMCTHACSVMSNSLWPCGLLPAGPLYPWDSLGKNTGVGCHSFLQGIFPTQGSNPCLLHLLHCRWILYCWTTGEYRACI